MAKTTKRNRFQQSVLAAAICLSVTGSYAAGLGKITVLSPLGQPLRAEIDLNASREELASITARVASPEAFKQVGIEYAPGVAGIRFALDKRQDGQYYLRMTTGRPVNEPFVDVLVELTWASGRMVREYTILLDPPEALSKAAPVPVSAPEAKRPTAAAPVPAAPVSPPPEEPAKAETPVAKPPVASPVKAPAQAETVDAAASTRLVKAGDTLSKIAVATKTEGVGLEQMLVALLRSNQDAFVGGNMNRLRAGKILTIPDAASAAGIAPSEAHQVVIAQARDFNAYRGRLAASVAAMPPAKDDLARQKDEGKIGPKVAEKVPAPEAPKDKLEVSRTETAKDSKAIQGRISALEEDLVARDRALTEASGRVAELERNLTDLKKLAEMKSQAGAQLQQQAQVAKPSGAEQQPMPPVTPAKPVEESKPAGQPVPSIAEPAAKPVQQPIEDGIAPAKKPAVAVLPPPVEQPGFVDENPALVYGGGGLVALLLGYLGFSAWRRKSQGEEGPLLNSRLSEADLTANSVFGSTGGQAVDTSASIQTDFSQASLAAIDADEGVDPVAEADVYMAYGRDAQAEEILLDALKGDPNRLAIPLKLLEIYSGRKNVSQFQKVATELRVQTGGAGPDWEKAAAMGRVLDPDNELYGHGAKAAEQQLTPALSSLSATPAMALTESPVALDETVTLPGQFSQFSAAADDSRKSEPAVLDFDLDLGAPAEPTVPALAAETPATNTLDFDLDLGGPALGAMPEADSLDIDLSMPELQGGEMSGKSADSAAGGLDFEFDLDTPAVAAPAATPSPEVSAMDFSGIDLDLKTPEPSADLPPAIAGDADIPDVTTKLELAQAYEEMGDREGARELLQEVLSEGSSRQQGLARDKLAALDA